MAIYYVRPNGSNTNTGLGYTTALAWATISKASSVMVAGDTCYIAPGIYRETVTPTNSGSSGLSITYQGDRKCEYFLDMQMGDVIISGLNAESDTTITRSYGFNSTKNYLNIINIDFENIPAYGILTSSYCNILNCNFVKGMIGTATISIGDSSTVVNCKIISSTGNSLKFTGNNCIVTNCIIKNSGQGEIFNFAGSYSISFIQCIIEGALISLYSGSTIYLYGCIWRCEFSSVNGRSIKLDTSAKYINAKGTLFIGNGSYFDISSTSTFLGCKFKEFIGGLSILGGVPVINYCEFENNATGVQLSLSGITLNNCYFKNCNIGVSGYATTTLNNCRFYACYTPASTVVNNSPTYGEVEVVAGIVTSSTNPISGTKSLKIAGYDYGTVFTQWIPCEVGKTKTVKLKVKKASATGQCTIRLGDQVVNCPLDTNTNTVTVTYTHHKTELVPLFINTRCNSVGGDFVQYDDIQ